MADNKMPRSRKAKSILVALAASPTKIGMIGVTPEWLIGISAFRNSWHICFVLRCSFCSSALPSVLKIPSAAFAAAASAGLRNVLKIKGRDLLRRYSISIFEPTTYPPTEARLLLSVPTCRSMDVSR